MNLSNLPNLMGNAVASYDMGHAKQGRALIFNHFLFSKSLKVKSQPASERDIQSFNNILLHFGFKISCYQDYTLDDIKNEISSCAKQDHSTENLLLIAIFTFGKYGKLAARDEWYDISNILDAFSPERCPSLHNKPKLLFVSACENVTSVSQAWTCVPHHRHFLVTYSTVTNDRVVQDNTTSVNPLCKLIKLLEKGTSVSIQQLILLLNQILYLKSNVSSKNLTPCITSTLTKKLDLKIINKDLLSTISSPSKKTTLDNLLVTCVDNWIEKQSNPLLYEIKVDHLRAIVFNNYVFDNRYDTREGFNNDIERLKVSLPKLGFQQLTVHNNLKKEAIFQELKMASKEDLDCLLVVILTFGGGRNLLARDKRYKIHELWQPFEKSNNLVGKPKIFLINACSTNYIAEQYVNHTRDFLFGFATCSKLCFMPNSKAGCCYIKAVCDAIDESDMGLELSEILTHAHHRLDNMGQIPAFNSSLSKTLAFPQHSPTPSAALKWWKTFTLEKPFGELSQRGQNK